MVEILYFCFPFSFLCLFVCFFVLFCLNFSTFFLQYKKAAEGSFDQPTCKLWACRATTAPPRFHTLCCLHSIHRKLTLARQKNWTTLFYYQKIEMIYALKGLFVHLFIYFIYLFIVWLICLFIHLYIVVFVHSYCRSGCLHGLSGIKSSITGNRTRGANVRGLHVTNYTIMDCYTTWNYIFYVAVWQKCYLLFVLIFPILLNSLVEYLLIYLFIYSFVLFCLLSFPSCISNV